MATVDSSGRVTHASTGSTEIRAVYTGVIGGTTLNVTVNVTSVSVACVATSDGYQCTATARLSTGVTRDATTSATWSASNQGVAIVNSAGHVISLANGQTEITARYQGVANGTWSIYVPLDAKTDSELDDDGGIALVR